MTPDEFKQAVQKCAAELGSGKVVTLGISSADRAKTAQSDWSQARVSCYEFPDQNAVAVAVTQKLFRAAAGGPIGLDHYDSGKTLLVVAPNDAVDAKVRSALGAPKFSAALYTAQP